MASGEAAESSAQGNQKEESKGFLEEHLGRSSLNSHMGAKQ